MKLIETINTQLEFYKKLDQVNIEYLHTEACKSIDDDIECMFPNTEGDSLTAMFLTVFD